MRNVATAALLALFLISSAGAQTTLNAAGATFPYPIYSKWFSEFHRANRGAEINYQSIGSGGGIQQLLAGTVDFGASDGPMTDEQLSKAKTRILHIPTVLGSVVPAYNLPGLSGEIRFSQQALAGIFLGKITNWNDAAIARDNPSLKLPNSSILVVHRSDGSGTSYIFTDFLSKVSPEWQSRVGKNTAVKWPIGLGAKGNEGVAGMVRQMAGAIGYVELIYAMQNHITYGAVQNAEGKFVKATLESTTAAAASVKQMPADFRVSITNAPGDSAYPISSFTWLLVPADWQDKNKEKLMVQFLHWMLASGEAMAPAMNYAALPSNVAQKVSAAVNEIH
jgi:phosphate transport system substrate-binding protein